MVRKSAQLRQRELRQILALAQVFGWPPDILENSARYDALCKLEWRASRDAERICNGDIQRSDTGQELYDKRILDAVNALTGFRGKGVPVFLSGDPRGYALKIEDAWTRANDTGPEIRLERDMGGYGLLAPTAYER
jgi:hypothetical protein